MKNAMQLKAVIKNLAVEKKIPAQILLQNYMMERFLIRISKSEYCENLIIKGGFLISSLVGVHARTTQDMDATIKSIPVDIDTVKEIIKNIMTVSMDDDINFELTGIITIRESAMYNGFRISLNAVYQTLKVPLKIDITIGDRMTPDAVVYKHTSFFDRSEIIISAYNIETVLAEKIETILTRGDLNTRARDFYDICIIYEQYKSAIDYRLLKNAVINTFTARKSIHILNEFPNIVKSISKSDRLIKHWDNYRNHHYYAKDITFDTTIRILKILMENIFDSASCKSFDTK